MTDEMEPALRLCTPTAAESNPIPGSVVRNCGTCGTSVWYDALQRSPYPGHPEQIICLDCGRRHPEIGPEIARLESDPQEARRRLAETLRERYGS